MGKSWWVCLAVLTACSTARTFRPPGPFDEQSEMDDFDGNGVTNGRFVVVSGDEIRSFLENAPIIQIAAQRAGRHVKVGAGDRISREEVAMFLAEKKLRPATLDDLRWYGVKYPDRPGVDYQMVALGSERDGMVPFLIHLLSRRLVQPYPVSIGFDGKCLFLVIALQ